MRRDRADMYSAFRAPPKELIALWRRVRSGAVAWSRDLLTQWREDRVGGLAAEIAFFALLSIFPAMVAVAGAVGLLDAIVGERLSERAEEEVMDFFERIFTEDAAGTVDAMRQLFRQSTPAAFTFGGLAAVWAVSRAFAAVTRALDVVYDIEERRSYVRLRSLALLLTMGSILVGAVMLAMLVLGPLLGTERDVAESLGFGRAFATFWTYARWPITAAVLVAWAATLFHLAPNQRTAWRWDLPGALITALGWIVGSAGLRFYLQFAGETNQIFGVLGGALILVVWLYLLGLFLLLGGEVNALLAIRRVERADDG